MLGNECRGTCTGTTLTCTGTPYRKAPVANLYRYNTNLYRYRHVRFAGIEKEYDSNARVRSSFNHQLEITREKGIKAKGKVEKAAFDS